MIRALFRGDLFWIESCIRLAVVVVFLLLLSPDMISAAAAAHTSIRANKAKQQDDALWMTSTYSARRDNDNNGSTTIFGRISPLIRRYYYHSFPKYKSDAINGKNGALVSFGDDHLLYKFHDSSTTTDLIRPDLQKEKDRIKKKDTTDEENLLYTKGLTLTDQFAFPVHEVDDVTIDIELEDGSYYSLRQRQREAEEEMKIMKRKIRDKSEEEFQYFAGGVVAKRRQRQPKLLIEGPGQVRPSLPTQMERLVPESPPPEFDEEGLDEVPPAILASVTQPLVPYEIWTSLTGREFHIPSSIEALAKTGIHIALSSSLGGGGEGDNDCNIIEWTPDRKTLKLLQEDKEQAVHGEPGVGLHHALYNNGEVLVYIGKFRQKEGGYGSDLPIIKTHSVIPMSPKNFAELLLDSSRVTSFNKMSLGRVDEVIFQKGVDTTGGIFGDGETKIVRNLTKPPLSKRCMEFVTVMHARRLRVDDDVSAGIMGGGEVETAGRPGGDSVNDGANASGCGGYIVVSRAVSGGRWSSNGRAAGRVGKDVSDGIPTDAGESGDENDFIRSEILLGVNLLRAVPGHPDKTEVTAVTHVSSPSVPTMLAGKVGVKGAVDFVRDIRALCE